MKRLSIGAKLGALAAFVIFSYYLGRPVYWEVLSRAVQGYGRSVNFGAASRSSYILSSPPLPDETKLKERGGREDPTTVRDPKKFMNHDVLKKAIWEIPPHGSELPPREAFVLSKEMVEFRAKKNVIMVTFANHAFEDFVLTWVRHLTDVGVTNLLVGAMDRKILEELFWKGVPVFDMGSEMNPADVGWGTPVFHKMGREKVFLVNAIMAMGFEVLFCDTDMVWMKNPLPYMERYPDADVLVSSDAVIATVTDESLEDWRRSYAALNIGIFHWRPTEAAKKFARAWQIQLEDEKIWDQNGFNELIQNGTREAVDPDNDRGLFYAFDRTLKVGILPVSMFCSGHTYFVQHLYKQLGLDVYAVHTTFQFAGTEGKRHRLREAQLFFDKPEYYQGRFIAFDASIPKELLTGGNHSVETHFALVNYQMKRVREALAVAYVLNRTLVMPEMWCRNDRLWFGHPGILHDTKTPQPFLCPMDHVFEVSNMLKNMPEEEFGPAIDFREYSFLENPRVPQEIKTSRLSIRLCSRGKNCSSEVSQGAIELPINMTDTQLRDEFSRHKDVKILDFSTMKNVFGGFVDKDKALKFRRRLQRYTAIWCCLESLERGHIYYDFFWDEKPGWKPLPPTRPENDHPPFD
ncbi:arabinosyltransferase XEG113 [Selaginella moellendorffii]|uniref:arabinosyltransferase XEG113 n=1 Tax=Selaginella moellendorffii TaxID=88036 RepID=UPI000D1CC388|nr:arabinosyltransferase XEG113 [Selaginella moellendorffii]|eukprot:XP_024520921.1 arabinosyltransferase XEG113 [Selaginella moellendorffii]